MSVFAVIIAYQPVNRTLQRLCQTLVDQQVLVIVVDNTPEITNDPYMLPKGCECIAIGYNSGIAHAQNIGILLSRERGASVIFFFDQDSTPDVSLISMLLSELSPGIPRIVGPVRIDERHNFEYASEKLNRIGYPSKVYGRSAIKPFHVDSMISSGTAVTAITFDLAGLMDEDFFIDHVDDEWCLRCRKLGIEILVHPQAVMQHSIGSNITKIGPLTIMSNSAERSYYCVRNSLLLFKKSHIPIVFALKSIVSTLIHQLLQLTQVKDKWHHFSMCMLGLFHGLCGVKGPKPNE